MTRREFCMTVAGGVVTGVLLLIAGNVNDSWALFRDQARNAADQASVEELSRKIDKMPTQDDVRELTHELRGINDALADIRSDIRVANNDIDQLRSAQNGLSRRQRYLWDSVTALCIDRSIPCATQNAGLVDPPVPRPDRAHVTRLLIRDKRYNPRSVIDL